MSAPSLLFESANGIARITLNRPERLNSFIPDMHARMRVALDQIAADATVRVVVLTGAGRAFCAGQDLAEPAVAPGSDIGVTVHEDYNNMVRSLRGLKQPVIAAVNGVAAGAGANLALACDIVVAAESASFLQAFVKIGLLPDTGGTYFLPKLLGPARAMGLALTGDKLSAKKAAEWGLIWLAVADAELSTEVDRLATQLAAAPPLSVAVIKKSIHAAEQSTLTAQLDLERDAQRTLGHSRDYAEGVAAFKEKRAARYLGH